MLPISVLHGHVEMLHDEGDDKRGRTRDTGQTMDEYTTVGRLHRICQQQKTLTLLLSDKGLQVFFIKPIIDTVFPTRNSKIKKSEKIIVRYSISVLLLTEKRCG